MAQLYVYTTWECKERKCEYGSSCEEENCCHVNTSSTAFAERHQAETGHKMHEQKWTPIDDC